MSTEGGEAKLYRIRTRKGAYCRIEVVHFGEGGKTIYGFAFNRRLFSAVRREYAYDAPIYVQSQSKATLTHTGTLKTKAGSKVLAAAFKEYRSFFAARRLAKCSER